MRKRLIMRLAALLFALVLVSALVMIVPAAGGSSHSDQSDIIESLEGLSEDILELPEGADGFKNPRAAEGHRKALCNKISAVIHQVEAGAYKGAINKLGNDVKNAIEEWVNDQWVDDLIEKVDDIIELLEKLLCEDWEPPTIVTVLRYPETPNYDEPVTVIAQVIDKQSGVKSVILSYQVDSSGWINTTMNITDGLYVAEIPSLPYDSAVNYKVYAYDWACNLAISEMYSYVVDDSYPPLISYVDRIPASPNYNESVTVFANVTEPPEASGVKNVTLWYRTDGEEWQTVEMILDQLYNGTIPAFSSGTLVQYKVRAFDYADNWAASGVYSYKVGAPLPNLPPVANFTESAEIVHTDEVITFNATSSYDPDGVIDSYFWDFGDGTNATGTTVDHAYADDGVYIVTLTVTDNDGLTATGTSFKTVLNRPPVASFTESATTVPTGEAIDFDASGSEDSDGQVISYVWKFGDGTSAAGVSVSHAYEDDGVYTVALTVIDDDGATSSTSAVETILNRPPVALFAQNVTTVQEDEVINFDASESYDPDGSIDKYFWDFGDGTNATGTIVDHAYAKDGNYTITLTVTDDDGASSSVSATVTVEAPAGWPLAFLAAIGLGIAILTATLLYALYRRRKKGGSAANPGNKPNPIVTLYVPAKMLNRLELKPLTLRKTQGP